MEHTVPADDACGACAGCGTMRVRGGDTVLVTRAGVELEPAGFSLLGGWIEVRWRLAA